jgi:adenylate cyclase
MHYTRLVDLPVLSQVAARFVRVRGLGRRATALAISVTVRIVVANAVAALCVAAYLTVTEDTGDDGWGQTIAMNAVFYGVAVVVFSAASLVRGKRLFAPSWRWLDEGTTPTDEQRHLLFQQPMRIALFPLRYWLVAAIVAVLVRGSIGASASQIIVSAVALVFGALVAAGLGFLLGERALRPVFAEALAGGPPETPSALGNGTRLVLAWALGSGVPLLGIVVTPFVVPDADLDPMWAMGLLAVVGLLSGFATIAIAARSITQPLARVRIALAQVGAGDLDTAVVVDDPGELGQLQAGVNEMVAGLRQRARLEDLFGRHVGAAVVQQALERGPTLGGETRRVSALFVDLTGSTALSRRLPPHDVVALLNRFFAAVVAANDAEGGWLNGYEGDGALCVFGAPTDQPDHATRALRAARRLAAAVAALREEDPDLDAGIGVATGDAVAGHVGTETRLEYTVIGPPVNTAARLTVAAKHRPCRVLVDRNAVEAASPEEQACWRPGEAVDLKGLDPGLAVYEPVTLGSGP